MNRVFTTPNWKGNNPLPDTQYEYKKVSKTKYKEIYDYSKHPGYNDIGSDRYYWADDWENSNFKDWRGGWNNDPTRINPVDVIVDRAEDNVYEFIKEIINE